jgi:predicted dehydrogenase
VDSSGDPAGFSISRQHKVNEMRIALACLLAVLAFSVLADDAAIQPVIRAGIIGLDTSHAVAFTKVFSDPKAEGDLARIKIVAAFPGGSQDISESKDRLPKITEQVKGMGVEIVDSIPALLDKVDVVLLESVDGRPHLEQVKPVFAAGKPVFIDKPLAGSLADAVAIVELGEKSKTPWFSSSSLRFGPTLVKNLKDPTIGGIVGCESWSPCHLEQHHPDLYWYGIHGVEELYTVMGVGCQSVQTTIADSAEVVTGVWKNGRVGTFRGLKTGKLDYGVVIFGEKKVVTSLGFEGYQPLDSAIATFFVTHKEAVPHDETLEIMAFMEAADESKRQGGKPVTLESVMEKAKAEAAGKIGQ